MRCVADEGCLREDNIPKVALRRLLAEGDQTTYHGGGEKGFTDYPALSAA